METRRIMKKRYTDESDRYNILMDNVSNSSILSINIINYIETAITGSLNLARREGAQKTTEKDMLKCEKAMKHYNNLKIMFNRDALLSDTYKDYILNNIIFIMKEKHSNEIKRLK